MQLFHWQIFPPVKYRNRPRQPGPLPVGRVDVSEVVPGYRYSGIALAVRAVCLAAFASLGLAAFLARSEDTLTIPFESGVPTVNLVHPTAGINAQMMSSPPIVKIKIIEGFNKKRERDIANDSERLLSLAIALKAELDRGDRPVEAAAKANEIEKLARTVKQKMSRSPLPGPTY